MNNSTWDVAFLVYSYWPPSRSALFLAELLEAWPDSGVHRADKMSSTSIGLKLDNNENEMEKPDVENVK